MRKIPTLYERNPDDRRHIVLGAVTPGCEWVLAGEGEASRKWDGTCVRIEHDWHGGPCIAVCTRHEVKPGKTEPQFFEKADHDDVTGKTVGWVPYATSGFSKFIDEALGSDTSVEAWPEGTYELIGPKINGNPDKVPNHRLEPHGAELAKPFNLTTEGIVSTVRFLSELGWEGLVWRHPDGRMAKLKARDLP